MKRLLVVTALLLGGCKWYPKAGPVPAALSDAALTGALSKYPNENKETLEQGRQLFSDNCSDCHDYPDVWSIREARWPGIMKQMAKEADLKQEESDLILHFILSAQADAKPTK